MNSIKRIVLLAAFIGFHVNGFAGVFGSGNTADSSLQFNFVRSTGLMLLKETDAKAVEESSNNPALGRLYGACRETMYKGLLSTSFELVEKIPDGGRYHALARRVGVDTIRISRSEIAKMSKAGTLTAPFLTALVLHEVGHDCVFDGKKLDDSADPDLNELALAAIEASGAKNFSAYLDIDFIKRVNAGENVIFLDLSSRQRERILSRYLDYLGDWIYLQNKDKFPERPAPASDFFANFDTSWFLGWGSLLNRNALDPVSAGAARGILQATHEMHDFAYFNGAKNTALPRKLSCKPIGGDSTVGCALLIDTTVAGPIGILARQQEILFTLDIFGNLVIRRVSMRP